MGKDCSLFGKEVAFTGRLASMPRAEAAERVTRAGGRHVDSPGPSTAILVTGQTLGQIGSGGRVAAKLLRYRDLKEGGAPIRLVEETDFLRMLGADEELADFSRLYTAAQVSRIVEAPLSEVRAWTRQGLLRPARTSYRLAWFDYGDIVLARDLGRLSAAGIAGSEIRRGLSEIASWLPGAGRILGRLEAAEAGLRLRMSDGGWAEPSGQRLLDFEPQARPRPSLRSFPGEDADGLQFARALEAEERGDLASAAAGYRRALEAGPDATASFNLGNVLYELGREAEAAESYLAALSADQDFVEAWNNLGNSLAALGRLEDSLKAYARALALEPAYPDAHCNLAQVLARLGRHAEAATHRAECSKAFPSERHLKLLREPYSGEAD
jgi:tetratricopeptide (TPR) repeat protein